VAGARFILDGGPSDDRFSLVEHPIIGRGLAAPLHRHTRENEYSFILEGQRGFWQAGNVAFADPATWSTSPAMLWHTFWNATDEPARLLEIIYPAGFGQFFVQLAALVSSGSLTREAVAALNETYGLHIDADGTDRIDGHGPARMNSR
jgi:hypothetical protein